MYGPPGTGKSYLASAIAKEAVEITKKPYKYLLISAADITSKWVGEGEKNIKTLFQTIITIQPCIVFIDEIDSLCTNRDEDSNESSRRLKTEFLIELQKCISNEGNNYQNVMLVLASNRPYDLDSAFLRRFEIKMEIPIPTIQDKIRHINKWIHSKYNVELTADQLEQIEMDKHLNYSDLSYCFKEASMRPFTKCIKGQLGLKLIRGNKPADDIYFISTDDSCEFIDFEDIPANQLKIEPNLLFLEFIDILKNKKPSTTIKEMKKIRKFTNQYGYEININKN